MIVGAWANTLSNLPAREERLDNICKALRNDFEIGNMSITHDLKHSLDDLHTYSMVKILPSLKDLTENSNHLQSRLQTVKKDKLFQKYLISCPTKEEDHARLISSGGPMAGKKLEAILCLQKFTLSDA